MPRPGLMSAPRPDEPPRFPDHRTGSVDGENRNRNTQSTRRMQTSRGAMCHLPFHSTPGFSRRFVSSGTLCVLCLSARRATRCRANHCRPLRDGGVGGAVGKRPGASHGCHASSLAALRRPAVCRGACCGPVWVKCLPRRTPLLRAECRHGPLKRGSASVPPGAAHDRSDLQPMTLRRLEPLSICDARPTVPLSERSVDPYVGPFCYLTRARDGNAAVRSEAGIF